MRPSIFCYWIGWISKKISQRMFFLKNSERPPLTYNAGTVIIEHLNNAVLYLSLWPVEVSVFNLTILCPPHRPPLPPPLALPKTSVSLLVACIEIRVQNTLSYPTRRLSGRVGYFSHIIGVRYPGYPQVPDQRISIFYVKS